MPKSHGYSSGKFALELQGKTAGYLKSVKGGEPFGTVVTLPSEAVGTIAKKHVGTVEFEPITITFGVGMADELYAWVAEVLERKQSPRNGAIHFLNYDFTATQRLEWKSGLITEIVFPAAAADGSGKEPAFLTVTIAPESTSLKPSNGKAHAGFSTKTQKKWLASNFRFSVSGLEAASSKVSHVSALTVTQPVVIAEGGGRQAGTLELSNIIVTTSLASAQPWLDWVDDVLVKGDTSDEAERTGTLQFLDQSMKNTLFTLTTFHVGPIRARRQLAVDNIEIIAGVDLELYCESMAFATAKEAAGAASAQATTQPTSPPANLPSSTAPDTVTDALVALLAGAGSGNDAQRTLRVLRAASLTRNPELVAARLRATTAAATPDSAKAHKRVEGESLGERWATEHASLEELRQIAALETGEWTAIRLADDHSLIAQLRQVNLVPPGGEGALELERDEFVEGVVAGAARVLRATLPHLHDG